METEKTLSGQLGKKGVRLDVYLEDEQGSVLRKNGLNEFVRLTRAFCEWQGSVSRRSRAASRDNDEAIHKNDR